MVLGLITSAAAADVAGVSVPERIAIGAHGDLVLNGWGVHTESTLERYLAALYLPARRRSVREILSDPGPKRIHLTFLRDMRMASLSQTIIEQFTENASASELESLKAPLDELTAILNRIGVVRRGMSVSFDYMPDLGASVVVDGKAVTKPIRGSDLYGALLRVWLSEDAGDPRLRRALLGQPMKAAIE